MTMAETTTCAASVDHGSPERLVISHLDAPYSPDLTVFPCYSDGEPDNLPLQYPYSSPESSQSSSESSYESIFTDLQHLVETRFAEIHAHNISFVHVEDRSPSCKLDCPLSDIAQTSYPPHTFLKRRQIEQGQENSHSLSSPSPFLPLPPSNMLDGYHALREVLRTPAASPNSRPQTCTSPSHRISPFADIANIVPPPSTPFDKALDIFSDLLSTTSGSPVVHRSPSVSPIARSDPVHTASNDRLSAWIPMSSPCSSAESGPVLHFSPRLDLGDSHTDRTPTRTSPCSSARPSMSPLTPISDVSEPPPESGHKLKITLKLPAVRQGNPKKRTAAVDYNRSPCDAKRSRCSLRKLLRETRDQAEDNYPVANPPASALTDVSPMEQALEQVPEHFNCDDLPEKFMKKRRVATPPSISTSSLAVSNKSNPLPSASHVPGQRSFSHAITPGNFVELSPDFPMFYRRFPASSYLSLNDAE